MHKISLPNFLGQSFISESRRRDLARDFANARREERLRAMLETAEAEGDCHTAVTLREALSATVRHTGLRRF
jgi:hypothetical protein